MRADKTPTVVSIGNPRMGWGSDVVAECIRALDIPYIALVPGASFRGLHDSLVNYLGNATPQMIVCLHEEHAVAIAEGYARVTERPMAAALHSNVGLMHATMPIFNAWCDRTPVLIFGATGPVDADARRPWIDWTHTSKDQGAIIRHYVKWDDQPASPQAAVESVLRAHQIACTRPMGPVYVCLDAAMQEAPLAGEVRIPEVTRFAAAAPPSASASDVEHILGAVRQARFPVLLMGRVSRGVEAWETRVRLAESLGALVMTSMHNPPPVTTEHPLHRLAVCGERPGSKEAEIIRQADLVVSFDWLDLSGFLRACLGASQTQTPTAATVVQCSLETYAANGWSMDHQALPVADINVLADADRLAAQLLERLTEEGHRADNPLVPRSAYDGIAHWSEQSVGADSGDGESMSLETLAHALADFAGQRDVTFARLPIGWPGTACRFTHPLDYLGKDAGGTVGTGPGHTIGAALALKDSERLVVGVIGDGDFLMGVNALWTASNLELPLILVIANNRGYYNDVRHQERMAVERDRPVENKWIGQALDTPRPDLVGFARAQGFDGEGPVTNVRDFAEALMRAEKVAADGGRYLIDAQTLGY